MNRFNFYPINNINMIIRDIIKCFESDQKSLRWLLNLENINGKIKRFIILQNEVKIEYFEHTNPYETKSKVITLDDFVMLIMFTSTYFNYNCKYISSLDFNQIKNVIIDAYIKNLTIMILVPE